MSQKTRCRRFTNLVSNLEDEVSSPEVGIYTRYRYNSQPPCKLQCSRLSLSWYFPFACSVLALPVIRSITPISLKLPSHCSLHNVGYPGLRGRDSTQVGAQGTQSCHTRGPTSCSTCPLIAQQSATGQLLAGIASPVCPDVRAQSNPAIKSGGRPGKSAGEARWCNLLFRRYGPTERTIPWQQSPSAHGGRLR